MFFRRKKSRPKNDGKPAPQTDAERPWRLNFGLSPGPAPARWIRMPVEPADDPAAVKDDAPAQD